MMNWGNHMSTGYWIFSILGVLIILALIVGMIAWLVPGRGDRRNGATATGESSRELLDRRLANDELTVDQYEQLRHALEDEPPTNAQRPRTPAGAPR